MVLAAHEVGLKPGSLGWDGRSAVRGFSDQAWPKLNGIVNYDFWVPEPTLNFLASMSF